MGLKGKKVLLMGLGILGGGVATAKFLAEKGAELTVTDMKDQTYLKPSLDKLVDLKNKVNFVLGEHREQDFLDNEIIVINPDVPADNKFVELARKAGKQIENELTLFYKFCPSKIMVGITGTRGKTTTTNWTGHILRNARLNTKVIGNDPDKPFLTAINDCTENTIAVIETPSFQLEIFSDSGFAPHIAIITNIFQDHLSRHKTMENYALTKANIFKNQTEKDFLILNKANDWAEFFIGQKPKSKVFLPDESILGGFDVEDFAAKFGKHNLANFLMASQACILLGVSEVQIIEASKSLPQIKFRQEKVFDNGQITIYNDTAATSPEATLAALRRFESLGDNLVLITGGTDRELDFEEWAREVGKTIKPENIVFLGGSATEKMKKELGWERYNEHESLLECLNEALRIASAKRDKASIIFSPGAKSFEKFKNEFDRGEKFNELIKEIK